jgi:hypothetical protein
MTPKAHKGAAAPPRSSRCAGVDLQITIDDPRAMFGPVAPEISAFQSFRIERFIGTRTHWPRPRGGESTRGEGGADREIMPVLSQHAGRDEHQKTQQQSD